MKGWFKKYWYFIVGGILLISLVILIVYLIKRKNKMSGRIESANPSNPSNPKRLLFVGDSQSAIKNYANGNDIKFTYPNVIRQNLEPKGYTIDVLAKGGETTKWMLKNLPDQLSKAKYDRIYIQGGGNDSVNLVPYEKYKENIEKMIELGQKAGAEVYFMVWFDREKVMDPNKVGTTRYVPSKEEMYKRHQIYFAWQKKIANDLKGKANGIVPMFELPKEYVPDGIHPNMAGARIIAKKIEETL